MDRHLLIGVAVVLTAGLSLQTSAVGAAEPAPIDQLVGERAEALIAKPGMLGVAVGVQTGEKSYALAAGQMSLLDARPVNENTLFEIGSITKAFTGLLLADAVARGEAELITPASTLLGPDVTVPTCEGKPIRLVDLATHTSGLPRLPSNMKLVNPFNPYAGYDAKRLETFLAKHKLARPPGETYEYSNLGMGLLGHALARRADKSYERLLKERIWGPLNMNDTTITLSDDQRSRLAGGISLFLIPAGAWDFQALAGCGAIRSTLRDMMIFLQANMAPDTTPMADAIRRAHEPRVIAVELGEKRAVKVEVGLGWHLTTRGDTTTIWHNGMTGGHSAYLAFAPKEQVGVVVLANAATSEVDELGSGLLAELLAAKRQPD